MFLIPMKELYSDNQSSEYFSKKRAVLGRLSCIALLCLSGLNLSCGQLVWSLVSLLPGFLLHTDLYSPVNKVQMFCLALYLYE